MTGKVLIVDDIPLNLKLLKNQLVKEYYSVFTANNGEEALNVIESINPDIILMDAVMNGIDGFNTIKAIRDIPQMINVPIIIITALTNQKEKIKGLLVGADEFMHRPINIKLLLMRIKSLLRFKQMSDILYMHSRTFYDPSWHNMCNMKDSKVAFLDLDFNSQLQINTNEVLKKNGLDIVVTNNNNDIIKLISKDSNFHLIVINSLSIKNFLQVCSVLKTNDRTRIIPILLIVDKEIKKSDLEHIWELGVNDLIESPVDINELYIRCQTQIKKHICNLFIQKEYKNSLYNAKKDHLTSLNNRFFLEKYIENTENQDRKFFLLIDIDNFKQINDLYGHEAGDNVLKKVAQILINSVSDKDFCIRFGGDEFGVILQDINLEYAQIIAKKIMLALSNQQIELECYNNKKQTITYTCSIGITPFFLDLQKTIQAADAALYKAKHHGKNATAVNIENVINVLYTGHFHSYI